MFLLPFEQIIFRGTTYINVFFRLCLSLFLSAFPPGSGDRTWAGRWVLRWSAGVAHTGLQKCISSQLGDTR